MIVAGTGSEQLAALAARIKAQAPSGLRVELLRGMKEGAQPLVTAVHDAAIEQLPHRGGLNEQVAGQKVAVSVRTGAKTAGVRMTTTAPDTKQTDSGYVRHPVFSRKMKTADGTTVHGGRLSPTAERGTFDAAPVKWVTQDIPKAKGWWTTTLTEGAPLVTPALMAAMESVAVKIQGV